MSVLDDYFARDQQLIDAAKEDQARRASEAQQAKATKASNIGSGVGTILGAIISGVATGNPLPGAAIGGSLGKSVAGFVTPGGNKDAAGSLSKADALYNIWKKRNAGQLGGDTITPGMTGRCGKCPGKCGSLAVTFLSARIDLPGTHSSTLSTSRKG